MPALRPGARGTRNPRSGRCAQVLKRSPRWHAPANPRGYITFRGADPALHQDFHARISECKKIATPYPLRHFGFVPPIMESERSIRLIRTRRSIDKNVHTFYARALRHQEAGWSYGMQLCNRQFRMSISCFATGRCGMLVPRYEAAIVDLQYAWKLPRRSWDQLTTCRAAVEQAFAALPADMKESVEVTPRICADARNAISCCILHALSV